MLKGIDLKKFVCITIISFILLTLISIQWIPFNYPTASWQMVLYWQTRDQLFIRHQYFFVFLPISAIIGVLFSIRVKGIYRKAQKLLFYMLLFVWMWVMYFENAVG